MYYSIDYYAFTIPTRAPFGEINHETLEFVVKAFLSFIPLCPKLQSAGQLWSIEGAKHPYKTRLRHPITDICLSIGSLNAHVYVELAGKACNTADAVGELDTLIRLACDRTSRIDFAVDIETEETPAVFSASRNNMAFKSNGHKDSPSGSTYYVGGRTSERMARVYRYEPPHPRAHLLRVEAEYKGDAAKASAEYYLAVGVQQACIDAHQAFQWAHPTWTPGLPSQGKIPYKKYRPENASTVRWLYGDVVTALSKAVASGLVDLDDWLEFLRGKLPTE